MTVRPFLSEALKTEVSCRSRTGKTRDWVCNLSLPPDLSSFKSPPSQTEAISHFSKAEEMINPFLFPRVEAIRNKQEHDGTSKVCLNPVLHSMPGKKAR